ncbi:Thioredoxin-like 4, chloroplastic [Apostasia shenzhenica]|uniref:Thioredoxin-like 4, chloroplastic n=1 Tax=Apostasia shenzhenica TaxID=1088818 RepID=A0A2I0AIS3_9ASPA|nr:Thioredoxin-like 4, chloroplastic [Apostasia shenzhenica]
MTASSFTCRSTSPSFIITYFRAEVQGTSRFQTIPIFFPPNFQSNKGSCSSVEVLKPAREFLRRRGIESFDADLGLASNLVEDDDDEGLCPVDCVREFKSEEEFARILKKAQETKALVVVDFYRTSCGSCKYIEQGFAKLCRGSGDEQASVVFLKHNVLDEYDEQSEVAERLRIKAVPLFHFYKNGILVEAFPTRDKQRIMAAILKYTSLD